MHHTTVYESNTVIPDKAIGYNKDKKVDDYSILTTGDGGIYATAEDLYKFDKALRTNQLLSEKAPNYFIRLPFWKTVPILNMDRAGLSRNLTVR